MSYSESDSLVLDTKWLKKHGYFCGWKSGGIRWNRTWGGESSISFTVITVLNNPQIQFNYTLDKDTPDERTMNYSISLVQVPCNLGGYRWAFKCFYCGDKVYTLFKTSSDYFGCRKCMKIVYESQKQSGKKFSYFGRVFRLSEKIEELYDQIRKSHYRGYPTRKVRRLRKLENQAIPTCERAEFEMKLLSEKMGLKNKKKDI